MRQKTHWQWPLVFGVIIGTLVASQLYARQGINGRDLLDPLLAFKFLIVVVGTVGIAYVVYYLLDKIE